MCPGSFSFLEGILAAKIQEAISEYCLSYQDIRPMGFLRKQQKYFDMKRHERVVRNAHPTPGIDPHRARSARQLCPCMPTQLSGLSNWHVPSDEHVDGMVYAFRFRNAIAHQKRACYRLSTDQSEELG
jgi:hypothetical protein